MGSDGFEENAHQNAEAERRVFARAAGAGGDLRAAAGALSKVVGLVA